MNGCAPGPGRACPVGGKPPTLLLAAAGLCLCLVFTHAGANTLESAVTRAYGVKPETQADLLALDHESGFYDSAFRVALSMAVKGPTIYYTTNGAEPRPSSALRYNEAIPVSTTTILRAAAFDRNDAITPISTRTYLFVPSVLRQTAAQLPRLWGTNGSQFVPASYGMADAETNNPGFAKDVAKGLRSLPSLSIVTDPEGLFSPETGIYLHPLERGNDWERAASLEMLSDRSSGGFRTDCGLRIHGGMSRRPEESPKHSFRLIFKRHSSSGRLRFPLFGDAGAQTFDELVLRAGSNDSWLASNGEQRRRAAYIRDEWMRGSMLAMGYPSSRGTFVHVYLNGLYWGVYNLCERPEAPVLSGDPSAPPADFDARKADKIESGDTVVWDKMLALANSGLADDQSYEEIKHYLDLTELADYLILNFYAGNSDWDRSSNWYAVRRRTPEGQFRFFVWDAERTFDEPGADTLGFDDDESPLRLFHRLSENTSFRELFARRVQQLLFDNGPLAQKPAAARYQVLANTVAPAMVAEAARWGTYRRDLHLYKTGPYERYTAETHWRPELERVMTSYLPQRRDILLNQFREHGLFPPVRAKAGS